MGCAYCVSTFFTVLDSLLLCIQEHTRELRRGTVGSKNESTWLYVEIGVRKNSNESSQSLCNQPLFHPSLSSPDTTNLNDRVSTTSLSMLLVLPRLHRKFVASNDLTQILIGNKICLTGCLYYLRYAWFDR